jgi:hypothetical protein
MALSSDAFVSFQFQHFLLTVMPGLFAQTAEEHAGRPLRAGDGLSMEAIPGIMKEALERAFGTWTERGSELPVHDAIVARRDLLEGTSGLPFHCIGPTTPYPNHHQVGLPTTADSGLPSNIISPHFVPGLQLSYLHDGHDLDRGTMFPRGTAGGINHGVPAYEQPLSWASSPSLPVMDPFPPGFNYFQPPPDGYHG